MCLNKYVCERIDSGYNSFGLLPPLLPHLQVGIKWLFWQVPQMRSTLVCTTLDSKILVGYNSCSVSKAVIGHEILYNESTVCLGTSCFHQWDQIIKQVHNWKDKIRKQTEIVSKRRVINSQHTHILFGQCLHKYDKR